MYNNVKASTYKMGISEKKMSELVAWANRYTQVQAWLSNAAVWLNSKKPAAKNTHQHHPNKQRTWHHWATTTVKIENKSCRVKSGTAGREKGSLLPGMSAIHELITCCSCCGMLKKTQNWSRGQKTWNPYFHHKPGRDLQIQCLTTSHVKTDGK